MPGGLDHAVLRAQGIVTGILRSKEADEGSGRVRGHQWSEPRRLSEKSAAAVGVSSSRWPKSAILGQSPRASPVVLKR